MDSADPPLAVHCLHGYGRRQLRGLGDGTETGQLGDVLATAPTRATPVQRAVPVRIAVHHQMAERATHRRSRNGHCVCEEPAMKTAKKAQKSARKNNSTAAKSTTRKSANKADGESAVLAKIAAMPGANRAMGERLHALIKANAPDLVPKLWFGLPGYAKDGKVICFFRSAHTFKERYMTFGFSDKANLDEGGLWPIYFALKELGAAEVAKISQLVKQSVS